MAKARSRTVARRMKDKWKAKKWYNILAPPSFDNVTIAETLADDPNKLINRVTEASLQDLTNDFRKSHVKLYFKIHEVEDGNAHTHYVGHTLTSDYLRRMVRRRRSKIDGVYDVITRDGAKLRVKPFATTDRRIQNSQKKIIRETMKKTIMRQAKTHTLAEFIKYILDGKIGSDIYKSCKKLYPVKRIEVYKTQVLSPPTIHVEETKSTDKKEKKEVKSEGSPDEKEQTEEQLTETPSEEKQITEESPEKPSEEPEKEEEEIKEKPSEEAAKSEEPEEKPEDSGEKISTEKQSSEEPKKQDASKEEKQPKEQPESSAETSQ